MWLPVCLISIKQSLLFFITRFPLKASLHFSLVVWLFVCWQTRKNANMYDWKQTCLHLAFQFLYPCDAFHIYFLFCKTAIMYVRKQVCFLLISLYNYSIMYYIHCWVILFSALKKISPMIYFGREFFRWLGRECVWGWRTMHPTCTRLVFLSDALQR